MGSKLNHLHLLGISYRKTDFELRERFAVDEKNYAHILQATKAMHIDELFILSTCNRTEYYLIHPQVEELIQQVSEVVRIDRDLLQRNAYRKKGKEALIHFFSVAAGMDSQIIGDHEIVSQIKDSAALPKQYGRIGNFMERMINTGLNASRLVRRNTGISDGSTSVAHAAAEWIFEQGPQKGDHVMILGLGQMGKAVANNLNGLLSDIPMILTNRTNTKAMELSSQFSQAAYIPWSEMESALNVSKYIILATHAGGEHVLKKESFVAHDDKVILDLTLPSDADPAIRYLKNIQYLNVDEISINAQKTLKQRKLDLPKAEQILQRSVDDFVAWDSMRRYVPILKLTKDQLATVTPGNQESLDIKHQMHGEKINHLVKNMAKEAKVANIHACSYMKAFLEFVDSNRDNNKQMYKLGTRDSELAMFQAHKVERALLKTGLNCIIEPIKSEGDLNLEQPLYEMGVQGVFTKALDIALIQKKIDFAVHSLKDVPTKLAKDLTLASVLKRADHRDVAILKKDLSWEDLSKKSALVATSSIRRKAMWLHRFPNHKFKNIRGNIQTRLKKFFEGEYDVLIMAKAALDRMNVELENIQTLDFLPSPSQGAIACICRAQDQALIAKTKQFEDPETAMNVHAERLFLRLLEGGCSSPIGAYSHIEKDVLHFHGALYSLDGQRVIRMEKSISIDLFNEQVMKIWVEEMKAEGASEILNELKLHGQSTS